MRKERRQEQKGKREIEKGRREREGKIEADTSWKDKKLVRGRGRGEK